MIKFDFQVLFLVKGIKSTEDLEGMCTKYWRALFCGKGTKAGYMWDQKLKTNKQNKIWEQNMISSKECCKLL